MNHQILTACLPAALALAVACAVVWIPLRLSGGRWQIARLRSLHRCERGGVQTLSFVLTLPAFIMVVMFIVQVSQLMVAVIVVNYAAFATARAASVWVPAQVLGSSQVVFEAENVLPGPIQPHVPVLLGFSRETIPPVDPQLHVWEYDAGSATVRSNKFATIFTAAALACAPLAPSRDYGYFNELQNATAADSATGLYATLVPSSLANARIPERIEHKFAYSFLSTTVLLRFDNLTSSSGPTYNPQEDNLRLAVGRGRNARYVTRSWKPEMVDWQDPITVTVTHEFFLLPGPGRYLATYLVRADGQPDEVSPRIRQRLLGKKHRIYSTPISASATFTNEGLLSVYPYLQSRLSTDVSFAEGNPWGDSDGSDADDDLE